MESAQGIAIAESTSRQSGRKLPIGCKLESRALPIAHEGYLEYLSYILLLLFNWIDEGKGKSWWGDRLPTRHHHNSPSWTGQRVLHCLADPGTLESSTFFEHAGMGGCHWSLLIRFVDAESCQWRQWASCHFEPLVGHLHQINQSFIISIKSHHAIKQTFTSTGHPEVFCCILFIYFCCKYLRDS